MLETLNRFYPIRYSAFGLCVLGALGSLSYWINGTRDLTTAAAFFACLGLSVVGVYDLRQTRRAVLRNYQRSGSTSLKATMTQPRSRAHNGPLSMHVPRVNPTNAPLGPSWT